MQEQITLKFIGHDSWSRPVYRGGDGTLWKDVNPRSGWKERLCKAYRNCFDGEPDVPMDSLKKYEGVSVAFLPRRDLWNDPITEEEMEKFMASEKEKREEDAACS